jgi:phosphoglycerate dehydrogenase-like enzyme
MKILHLARAQPNARLFTPRFRRELAVLGDVHIQENGAQLTEAACADMIHGCDVLLTGWECVRVPAGLARSPGRLRYICHITGSVEGIVPVELIRAGLGVTNWGDAPGFPVAEGALALLLACLKQFPDHLIAKRSGAWRPKNEHWIGSMRDLRLGLYGYGAIGRAFHELCRPLQARLSVYDPFATNLPSDIRRANSLRELFAHSDAVAIHAALTEDTLRSVTAELLALLPDGGLVINTARGDIVDQEALFAELAKGRLRAGLDVLAGNNQLPADHPAMQWPNLLLSSHIAHYANWPDDPDRLEPWHEVALDNLRRFQRGDPLRFLLTEERLARST